jgi:valyl-tRNA synthetase
VLRRQVGAEGWPDSIMAARYPAAGPADEAADRAFSPVLGIVDAIRNIRGEMGIPYKVALGQGRPVHVAVADPAVHALLTSGEERRVGRLAGLAGLKVHRGGATPRLAQSAVAVGPGFEVRVPLAGVIDLSAETSRIDKELAKVDADLALLEKKLSNPSFVERAPAEVVAKDRARVEELREARQKLTNHRAMMTGADDQTEEATMETTPPNVPPTTPTTPQGQVAEKLEQAATAVAEAAQSAMQAVSDEAKVLEKKARPVVAKARKAVKKAVARVRKAVKKAAKKSRKPAKKARKAARKPAARKVVRKAAKGGRKARKK